MNNFLTTFNDWSFLPSGTIYRGNGTFDFYADGIYEVSSVKEKLIELTEDATVVYKKPGENTKISAELKKEGKETHKNKGKPGIKP